MWAFPVPRIIRKKKQKSVFMSRDDELSLIPSKNKWFKIFFKLTVLVRVNKIVN